MLKQVQHDIKLKISIEFIKIYVYLTRPFAIFLSGGRTNNWVVKALIISPT